jgi:hypothetical protein
VSPKSVSQSSTASSIAWRTGTQSPAQLVRNLAELAFAPRAATRARGLVWSADGDDAFTLAAPGIDADAIVRVTVDGAGDVPSAWSPDRPRDHGRAGYLHEPYRLEFDRHERRSSGERIPLGASGTFGTADGDWPYWRFEVLYGGLMHDSSGVCGTTR